MNSNSEKDDLTNEIRGKMIIHWNYRGFYHLPEALRSCSKDLREIYLKENKLTNLPNWIIELVNVTHLYLHGNNLKKVPTQLASMAHLALLDLGDNGLDDLPSCFGDLVSLEFLRLDHNYLKKLPSELRNLKNLRSLSVCDNEFAALPEWLGSMEKLEQLRADENFLEELPNGLAKSKSLDLVSICSNRTLRMGKISQRSSVNSFFDVHRLTYLPLDGFTSRPSLYFNSNPRLNYLSYPMYLQLIDNPGNRDISLGKYWPDDREKSNNFIISIVSEEERIFIRLPRQLLKVRNVDDNIPVSLWELALRRIYDGETSEFQDDIESLGLSYNLLANGPTAVCVNENCRESIFTECWLITAISCPEDSISKSLTIIAPYCCQKYAYLQFLIPRPR